MLSGQSKVALVTGASAGIGEATVRRLVRAGWRVALVARREERLMALAREIDPAGNQTLPLPGDITDLRDRERWVAAVRARWHRLDALVNNAGFGQRGPVELVPIDAIRRNFETNVFSLIALTQLVIPLMREQGGGRIINIGSVSEKIARPFSSVYDATKHALGALSDGLRGELAPFGIAVVVIRPGFIRTEFVGQANETSRDVITEPGPYAAPLSALEKNFARARQVAVVPDVIARVVERALAAPKPRTRYSAPLHAKLFLFARWLLPDRWLDAVFRIRV